MEEKEQEILQWRIKKIIKRLNEAKGNGTSMISLVIPPGDQISRVSKMLTDEAGTASNIKSRVNKQSVLGAITSAQQKLKQYNKVPPTGLVIYCGEVVNEQGKPKKLVMGIEPFKPVNTSLYMCDNHFHTEALSSLLESDSTFGFIVMDGSCTLFGTLSGNNRVVKQIIYVDLPKKHGRGGQSALRFARLRLEKRHNYLRKVTELATQHFITNDVPNVKGLVLAGLSLFKNDLNKSDLFDPRLAKIVVAIVDVAYGGENGFSQAIDLASESLLNVRYVAEQKLLSKLFEEIDKDTGKYCYGVNDLFASLEQGAVETLICWEELDILRVTFRNGDKLEYRYQTPEQRKLNEVELEYVDEENLTEYFAENYRKYGCKLEFVSDKSEEGSQFCRGFGGIGAILRYKCEFYNEENYEESDDSSFI